MTLLATLLLESLYLSIDSCSIFFYSKSSSHSWYCAEAWNNWWAPSPRLGAWALGSTRTAAVADFHGLVHGRWAAQASQQWQSVHASDLSGLGSRSTAALAACSSTELTGKKLKLIFYQYFSFTIKCEAHLAS